LKEGSPLKVAVIGGGAAGFFAAIQAKTNFPEANVFLFEKSQKVLAKVKISGGGRCNVTNGCSSVSELIKGYPRGEKKLKSLFYTFNNLDTQAWFTQRGVALKTEEDGRVFPKSDSSQTIIDCLFEEISQLQIPVKMGKEVVSLKPFSNDKIEIQFKGESNTEQFDKVIVASGGSPKLTGLKWLEDLGHNIETPIPSLFTFNIPNNPIKELMGLSAPNALVKIQGTKLSSQGPLLITHWGFSGPAVLKLSAFGARILYDLNYQYKIQVNWVGNKNAEDVKLQLEEELISFPKKQIGNVKVFGFANRLWHFLVSKSGLSIDKIGQEIGKKQINKLIEVLTNDIYEVSGKTTFKEEFVTCGGVCLDSVDLQTMQSKVVKNLYFAGEVLDIDGITGGYNFQAAWSTGFVAGKLG
jgi:predicted Rossmann fold flavoprotein